MTFDKSTQFTLFGASGFIGSNLKNYLESQGAVVFCPPRDFIPTSEMDLGHVIYCIGLTADFRKFPFETVNSHVCKLVELLKLSTFQSFLYLSSARVYLNNTDGCVDATLAVNPTNTDDLYNLSKLMGESVCLSINHPNVRIVRLSNVIGIDFESDNFLYALIKSAVDKGEIVLQANINNAKDYIYIDDVKTLLINIVLKGKKRMYNVASGLNVSNKEILKQIQISTDCKIVTNESGFIQKFPSLDISNLNNEFNFMPNSILDKIPELINYYKNRK